MLDEKLIEVIKTPPDSAFAIVTQNNGEAHVVNSWNSYIEISGDKIVVPVGGFLKTEDNLKADNRVKLTITNREVMGKRYKGTGFLVSGTAFIEGKGTYFDLIKSKFPWARAALVISCTVCEQTL
jgi:hypothetical protein